MVYAILREVDEPGHQVPALPIATMPAHHWNDLDAVMTWEGALRTNQRTADPDDPQLRRLHPYWRQIVMLLEAYRQIIFRTGEPIEAATLAVLHPSHRWLLAHRWPDRATGLSTEEST